MKLTDFKINQKFWMSGKQYVCADIGKHCIVACPYDVGEMVPVILSTYNEKTGKSTKRRILEKQTPKRFRQLFPDSLQHVVIFWYNWPACQKTKTQFQKQLEKEWNKKY